LDLELLGKRKIFALFLLLFLKICIRTIYKQLINLYGEKFDDEKLLSYKPIIHQNILHSMKKLIDYSIENQEWKVLSENEQYKLELSNLHEDGDLTPDLVKPLTVLWSDPGIQHAFKAHSRRILLLESLEYWMKKLQLVSEDAFIPSLQDVLRTRAPTTGITEIEFHIEGAHFLLIDVGGQRNERKKWIHCFEGVTSIIFVASLNSFDQVLYEDEKANGMLEALDLFEQTVNLPYFTTTDVILFLNKSDLFREKIAHTPITVFFKNYQGKNDFDSSVAYIEEQFRRRLKGAGKDLYCHVTCATETSNVQFTFNAVKNIIIRRGLADAGIMN
jgi:GTPase SAR1 family protein